MAKKKKSSPGKRKAAVVNNLVNAATNGDIRGLHSQQAQVKRDANAATKTADNQYTRAKDDLNYIHGETTDYLGNLKGQMDTGRAETLSRSDAAAAALQQRLGGTYSGATNDVGNALAALGISGGANFSGLASDAAFAQSQGAQSSAMARSTADQSSANAGAFLQGILGMNQGSHLSNLGKANNAHSDSLAQIQKDRNAALGKIGDALTEVRKGRGDLYTQLFAQLQQSGWKGLLGSGKKKH